MAHRPPCRRREVAHQQWTFQNLCIQNRFLFVVATHGTADENAWAANKARYDAETFQYRGNGAVDIVNDTAYNTDWHRNVILYGNGDTNSAWKPLLGNCPIQVNRNGVKVGDKALTGSDLATLFVYPHKARGKWVLVRRHRRAPAIEKAKATDRLAIFSSGVAYPDWTVFSAETLKTGVKGLKACGFFGNDWTITNGESAWN